MPKRNSTATNEARRRASGLVLLAAALLALAGPARACIDDCLEIWTTQPGGGELVVRNRFATVVPVYETLCTGGRAQCLYSAIDPCFLAPQVPAGEAGFHPRARGSA